MKISLKDLQEWLHQRSPRERFAIFLIGFVLIYFIWNIIFMHSLTIVTKRTLENQKQMQAETEKIQKQIATIMQVVSDPTFQQMFSEQKKLKTQTEAIVTNLTSMMPNLLKTKDFPDVVKDILSIKGNIKLVDIKRLPTESWIPKELTGINLPSYLNSIYKYTLELGFKGNYFDTLAYLSSIEKLPRHLYWDSLDYKVTQYPEANITVRLHVLIEQKSEK